MTYDDLLKQLDAGLKLRDPHRAAVLRLRFEDDPVPEEKEPVPLFERRRLRQD